MQCRAPDATVQVNYKLQNEERFLKIAALFIGILDLPTSNHITTSDTWMENCPGLIPAGLKPRQE